MGGGRRTISAAVCHWFGKLLLFVTDLVEK
jgi:hypothetical protein